MNSTSVRIASIKSLRLAARAARLLRLWGNRPAAELALARRRELQVQLRGGRAVYNHQ